MLRYDRTLCDRFEDQLLSFPIQFISTKYSHYLERYGLRKTIAKKMSKIVNFCYLCIFGHNSGILGDKRIYNFKNFRIRCPATIFKSHLSRCADYFQRCSTYKVITQKVAKNEHQRYLSILSHNSVILWDTPKLIIADFKIR